MGEDGHTASIFPGTTNIDNKKNSLIVIKNNHETFSRVSLTFSYLMKARRLLFLICGKSKAEAFSKCVYGNKIHEHFPSNYIFNNYKRRIDIYCDKAAASKLYK